MISLVLSRPYVQLDLSWLPPKVCMPLLYHAGYCDILVIVMVNRPHSCLGIDCFPPLVCMMPSVTTKLVLRLRLAFKSDPAQIL